jgi:ABC-type phosphate/phosphonate transport system ATPase subunit
VLFVTHDVRLARRYAARVIGVVDGRIVDDTDLPTGERVAAEVCR